MLIQVYGAKCIGIEAVVVTVEVDVTMGIGIHLCGLADVALTPYYQIDGENWLVKLGANVMFKTGNESFVMASPDVDLRVSWHVKGSARNRSLRCEWLRKNLSVH